MTINELQKMLIREIERLTKDMALVNQEKKSAALKGYPQALPVIPVFSAELLESDDPYMEAGTEKDPFPYFIVRADSVEYRVEDKEVGESNRARVLIAFAIYDENPDLQGYFTLTAIMERVVKRFQNETALGPFFCSRKMNLAYQEDDTFPRFFGALEMIWYLPDIEMEEME